MILKIYFAGKVPKANENIDDCQDAFQVREKCAAIADGVSQSIYPAEWAELLVGRFCTKPEINRDTWQDWLQPIQDEWKTIAEKQVESAKKTGNPAWITNHNRLTQHISAKSTFVGLQIKNNRLHISLIGDSCLFIWKDGNFSECIPYKSSSEFDAYPGFFASIARDNTDSVPFFIEREITENEWYVLATDALSKWILENIEAENDVFSQLLTIKTQADLEKFVSDARNISEIKMEDDDVALVVMQVLSDKTPIVIPGPKDGVNKLKSIIKKAGKTSQAVENTTDKIEDRIRPIEKSIRQLKRRVYTLFGFAILLCFIVFLSIPHYHKISSFFVDGLKGDTVTTTVISEKEQQYETTNNDSVNATVVQDPTKTEKPDSPEIEETTKNIKK
ncbi:MAG: hypothetical protein LBN93_07575 [Candidatus Symbiothrix sp.]|jgi:serine/threonine protein phosphatase PrpC|nr:hypothetical protein [Candidatus Symbiothrix sp.]